MLLLDLYFLLYFLYFSFEQNPHSPYPLQPPVLLPLLTTAFDWQEQRIPVPPCVANSVALGMVGQHTTIAGEGRAKLAALRDLLLPLRASASAPPHPAFAGSTHT